jgi:ABC-2 type transport system ATP-binding protein
MRRLIKRLARNTTIIISTHIMQEVDAVCDRVLMLRNGQLALDQSLADLYDTKMLLLCTSTGVQSLPTYLSQLPQIASLQHAVGADGFMHFDLHLHPNVDINTASNNVAQCVIKAGAKMYQLQVSTRSLDRVFREVYDNGN